MRARVGSSRGNPQSTISNQQSRRLPWLPWTILVVVLLGLGFVLTSGPGTPDYRFLHGHTPVHQTHSKGGSGGASHSARYLYTFEGDFDTIAREAKSELESLGLSLPTSTQYLYISYEDDVSSDLTVTFYRNSKGKSMRPINLATGELSLAVIREKKPGWVTVMVERRVPLSLWEKLWRSIRF
jgi:hypothetical protein